MTNSIAPDDVCRNSDQAAGLYVHVPFCRSKCSYCGFYSLVDLSTTDTWREAVLREASRFRTRFDSFDTVYIGGGTPSCLNPESVNEILTGLRAVFPIEQTAEITVEMNPDDVRKDMLHIYRDAGVNRLSLGIQSLDDDILEFLGRRHTAADAMNAVNVCREQGFTNIGIDLMYNIPGQPIGKWMKVLNAVLAMEPEHISCYELSLESGTPLANRIGTTNFPHRNSEHDRLFFLETSRTITSRGYIHYEVSNFALNRSYRSRHNLKYWKREPYLGLGPSAHSMRGMKRWWNIRDVNGYITRVNRTESPVESSETLSEEQVVLETLLLGFRNSEGLPLSVLHADENTTRITRDLLETGLLRENNKRIIPTIEGYLVADNLPLYYGPGITSTLSPR